jgi:hypothetical protein
MNRKAILSLTAAAGLLIASSLQQVQAGPADTPGHKMQRKGSVAGHPGASGYAPGHVMQQKGSRRGYPGASGYAPGRTTTGSSVR